MIWTLCLDSWIQNCALITRFQTFARFDKDNRTFDDIIRHLPVDKHIPKSTCFKNANETLQNIGYTFDNSYEHFCRTAESNVLQFLSRINCMSFDALSFIQLTRGLKEFITILTRTGLRDWLTITTGEYMKRYTSICISSCRTSIINDN